MRTKKQILELIEETGKGGEDYLLTEILLDIRDALTDIAYVLATTQGIKLHSLKKENRK